MTGSKSTVEGCSRLKTRVTRDGIKRNSAPARGLFIIIIINFVSGTKAKIKHGEKDRPRAADVLPMTLAENIQISPSLSKHLVKVGKFFKHNVLSHDRQEEYDGIGRIRITWFASSSSSSYLFHGYQKERPLTNPLNWLVATVKQQSGRENCKKQ